MYVTVPRYVKSIYWIGSTISLLAGMHIMLHSSFNQVFGQGNVLYGRIGSIKRTLKGFVEEQNDVLLIFFVMFFFFGKQIILPFLVLIFLGISVVGTVGLVFYQNEAIAGTVITIISMIFWYRDSLEVYNLFKWTEQDEQQDEADWKSSKSKVNNQSMRLNLFSF